jgi:nucleoside-diphosphate-sugar epimerase
MKVGVLYGPNVPSSEFLLTLLRLRLMALPGGGHSMLPWIALPDAIAALERAIRMPGAGGVYNVVDDEAVEMREFVNELAEVFDAPKPYRLPYWIARTLMPFNAQFLDRVVIRASNRKIKDELQWAPVFPSYREGIRRWASESESDEP